MKTKFTIPLLALMLCVTAHAAQSIINIGTTANDGTGDPARTAFTKTNDNFTELYTAIATKASLTGAETLTNKTLTAPVLTTPALGTPASGNFSSGSFTWPTFNQSTTGNAATVTTINGRIAAGTNVTITGSGTAASPYSIAASGGGAGSFSASDITGQAAIDAIADADTFVVYDASGSALAKGSFTQLLAWINTKDLTPSTVTATTTTTGSLQFEGATDDDYETTVGVVDPTADRLWLVPNAANDTFVGNATSASLTNKDLTDATNTLPAEIGVALSDETTAIATGTAKVTIRMPFAMTVTAVRASLTTVSSSGLPTVDINEGGTTILSTKLTLDASEKTSTTAATAAVISDTALASDAEITFDIDVAGTGAAGLKVWIIGTR